MVAELHKLQHADELPAAKREGVIVPRVADVGVTRWVNAFCSGDHVGRWLWSDAVGTNARDPIGHPMVDTVGPGTFGRSFGYDHFVQMPPMAVPFADARQVEVCLGFGAQTTSARIPVTSSPISFSLPG